MHTPPRRPHKLLIVGWDAADWKLITPLLDRGEMPTLGRLVGRGVMGKLSSTSPMLSPILWTSIATGKRADKHGILASAEFNSELGTLLPRSRGSLKTSTVWDILRHEGLRGHVINWPASHPVESARGVTVSDAYPRIPAAFGEAWPLEPGTVSPPVYESALAELRVHPGELIGEQLLPFLPELARIDQSRDHRVIAVAEALAQTASVHAAATWALEHEAWDFAAVHYGGLETLSHGFAQYQAPRMAHVSEADFELYREVVDGAYRFHDMMLGRLLQLAGEETMLMLVSDHGFCTGEFRPLGRGQSRAQWHRSQGVFCLAGPTVRRDELIHQASILDITPTVLTMFDLPVGEDMDGQPLFAVWENPPVPRRIATWDDVVPHRRADAREATPVSNDEAAAFAELGAFGYLDALLPIQQYLERLIGRSEQYHLALSYRAARRLEEAADVFEGLLENDGTDVVIRLYLAACYYELGEHTKCRDMLASLDETDEGKDLKEKEVLSALLLIADNRPQEALERLDLASQTHRREPQIFCAIGRAYLGLARYADADEAFGRALAIDEDSIPAHGGLALSFAKQRRWEEAADQALSVVGLDHHQGDAHFVLGMALFQLDRPERALQAFAMASALRPDWQLARQWASTLRTRVARSTFERAQSSFS